MKKSIPTLAVRHSADHQPSLSPPFSSAIETLISDDSNPVFIVCSKSDSILIINDYVRKNYGSASYLNHTFSHIINADEFGHSQSVLFQNRWYKMNKKEFELDGWALSKITLLQPDELPSAEMMTGIQKTISMVLHRFRSPLTGVLGYLDILSDILESEKESVYLDRALTGINHLSGLLDELEPLTIQVNASEGSLFDPANVVLDLIKRMPESNNRIVVKTINNELIHSCNQTLSRLLSILIENALNYSPELPGSVKIVMNVPDSIEITNSGSAIPDDMTDKIFDPFVSSRSDKMGNGLTIARILAERIGVNLTLMSNQKDRITFLLKFPQQTTAIYSKKAI